MSPDVSEPVPAEPREVDRSLLDYRPPYWDESLPFVLLWSEKAGCTTLLTWFLHHAGQLPQAENYGLWVHDWERDVMRARDGYLDLVHEALEEGAPVFQLVRDPYHRAVSSYLALLEEFDDESNAVNPVRREIRTWLYGDPYVQYSFSIRQYLAWLDTQDVDQIERHLAPQTTALDESLSPRLIRLENLATELARIEEEFGLEPVDLSTLPQPPHHANRTDLRFADRSVIADMQPAIPQLKGPGLPVADDFLADDVRADIGRIYARDIERLGYSPPDVSDG